MRAYLYHWSVLRCGIPVTERNHVSTRPKLRAPCALSYLRSVAYQATRKLAPRSE